MSTIGFYGVNDADYSGLSPQKLFEELLYYVQQTIGLNEELITKEKEFCEKYASNECELQPKQLSEEILDIKNLFELVIGFQDWVESVKKGKIDRIVSTKIKEAGIKSFGLYSDISDFARDHNRDFSKNRIDPLKSRRQEIVDKILTISISTTSLLVGLIGLSKELEKYIADSQQDKRIIKRGKQRITAPEFPNDLRWEEILIHFLDNDGVIVKYREKTEPYNFEIMGFMNDISKRPDIQWGFLKLLAIPDHKKGLREIKDKKAQDKIKKIKEKLSKSLIAFFGINDDPFHICKKVPMYSIKINLKPEPDYNIRNQSKAILDVILEEENDNNKGEIKRDLEIVELFEGQTPSVYEEEKTDNLNE